VQAKILEESKIAKHQTLAKKLQDKIIAEMSKKLDDQITSKIQKINNKPAHLKRPIKLRAEKRQRLGTIVEETEELDSLELEINKEWGTFGDLVEQSRRDLVLHFSKAPLETKDKPEEPVKESLEEFMKKDEPGFQMDESISFQESSKARWTKYFKDIESKKKK